MDIDSVLKGHGIGIGGSNIKSLQRGTTSVGSTGSTTTVTISPIDVSKAIIKISVSSSVNSDATYIDINAQIATSTSITLSKNDTSTNYPVDVNWEVIEFNNVKSRQTGDVIYNGYNYATGLPVTISNINTSKSLLFFSFKSASVTSSPTYNLMRGEIINNTSIKFTAVNEAVNRSIHWEVIEFL